MDRITQSVAKRIPLKAYLAGTATAATGKTIAVVISKNGAAFGNPSGGATNATEIGNGWYYYDSSTTDTGTAGPLIVRGTEGTVDDVEIAFSVEPAIAAEVWDEVLTAATHNIATSAGRRLRGLSGDFMHYGTAAGGGNNSITLDAGASAVNGTYDPGLVSIAEGTGAGQARLIIEYNGSTKVATVDRDWRTNPDNTSVFFISGVPTPGHVHEGLATAGSSSTITFGADAKATDDIYNGQTVFLKSGTGQDQARIITDYVGATKVATVSPNWITNPDTTTGYIVVPVLTDPTLGTPPTAAAIADAVWDEALAGHLSAGSTGEALDNAGGNGSGFTAIPWNASWDAEVQSEVQDALDLMFAAARSEPGQGAPAVNATALGKLDFLYKLARNKLTQDATTLKVFDDAGTTVDHKSTVSDDGTTYTRGEIVSGP